MAEMPVPLIPIEPFVLVKYVRLKPFPTQLETRPRHPRPAAYLTMMESLGGIAKWYAAEATRCVDLRYDRRRRR